MGEQANERKEAMKERRRKKRLPRLTGRCGINIEVAPSESKSRSRWQAQRVALSWTLLMARDNKYHVFHQRAMQTYSKYK